MPFCVSGNDAVAAEKVMINTALVRALQRGAFLKERTVEG